MEEKYIVTMDLGTQKLGVSVATVDSNKRLSLKWYNEFEVDGIKHSRVSNPSKLAQKLNFAIERVESCMQIKMAEVMVNTQRYGVRELERKVSYATANGMNVSQSDIEMMQNLAWEEREGVNEDEEIVGCVAQSYDLDNGEYNVNPDEVVGMCTSNIVGKYKVYAIKQASMNVIDNAFRDCNLVNIRKVFVPEYMGRCILSDNDMQGGVALIELGAGASSVSIFAGGVLRHYGAIPFGGANISSDIANVCGIDERLAEQIKMAYGGCMPDRLGVLGEKKLRITNSLDKSKRELSVKYLSEIITARQREIIDALLYDIQQSGYADKLKNGVILTGGGAAMLNICPFIREISGYNAKVATTNRDKMESVDESFYNLGAGMSAGLLKKYALQDIVGCEDLNQSEPSNGELFGASDIEQTPQEDTKKPAPQKETGFFGSLIGKGGSRNKTKGKTEKEEAAKESGSLFGDDEEV